MPPKDVGVKDGAPPLSKALDAPNIPCVLGSEKDCPNNPLPMPVWGIGGAIVSLA